MNGPQHYSEAEAILRGIDEDYSHTEIATAAAHAQVHATLAMTAAIVEGNELDSFEVAATGATGLTEWGKAVRQS